jgi:hypothetical protein
MTLGARWPVSTARFFKEKKPEFQVGIFPLLVFSPEQLMAMLRLLNIVRLEAAAKKKARMGGLFLKKSITNSNTNVSVRLNVMNVSVAEAIL